MFEKNKKIKKNTHYFLERPLLVLVCLQVGLSVALDSGLDGLHGRYGQFIWALFVFFVLFVVAVHLWFRRRIQIIALVALVVFSAGLFFLHQKNLSPNIFSKKALYEAEIIAVDSQANEHSRFVVDLVQRLYPVSEDVAGRVLLTIAEACDLAPGTIIQFTSSVKKPTSFRNPGVFNYASYLKRKNIYGRSFVENCDQVEVVSQRPPIWQEQLRTRVLTIFQQQGIRHGDLMAALILGAKTIDAQQQELIRGAGLSHLFAISGSHFAVMAGLFFLVISGLIKCVPNVVLHVPRQKFAAAATLIFNLFYLWLVFPQPSITRAGIMIACVLLAIILERQKQITHFIILSACIVLFFNPLSLFDVAFILSYVCVLILVIVYPRFVEKVAKIFPERRYPKALVYFGHVICVTWLLNILLIPLILYSFQTSPLSGLVNNLWAVPLFDLVIVPLLFVVLVFALSLPFVTGPLVIILDHVLDVFVRVMIFMQDIHLPNISVPTPHLIHIFIFYAGLFLFFKTKKRLILWMTIGCLVGSLAWTAYSLKWRDDLRVTQIDVGQGDAILIEASHKKILIDTGGHRFLDIGQLALIPFLKHQWISTIDLLVLTHPDLDHYGGAMGLFDAMNINEVWVGSDGSGGSGTVYDQLMDEFRKRSISVKKVSAGDVYSLDEKNSLGVLWPLKTAAGLDDNEASLVTQLNTDWWKGIFLADVPQRIEQHLVQLYGEKLSSDLVKIAHHGAKKTTTNDLLMTAHPRVAIIGVSQRSPFGHPRREVLERLEKYGVTVLRTDLNGATGIRVRHRRVSTFAYVNETL